jgi:hypothetical protein
MALPGGKHLGAWCAVEYGHEAGRVQGRALPRWAAPAWPGREPWRALPSSYGAPNAGQCWSGQMPRPCGWEPWLVSGELLVGAGPVRM